MLPVLDNLYDLAQMRGHHWQPGGHILEYLQWRKVKTPLIGAWCAVGGHGYVYRGQVSAYLRVRHLTSEERSEEHTSELQSHLNIVCRLLLEKKKQHNRHHRSSTDGH